MRINEPLNRRVIVYLKRKAFYREVADENAALKAALTSARDEHTKLINDKRPVLEYFWFTEPGHYYSPLLDRKNVKVDHLLDLDNPTTNQREISLPGIELNKDKQQALLATIAKNIADLPDYNKSENLRYRYDNDQFGRMDAAVLFLMLRHFKPRQIIEVGSGWSSALMLDVNEKFADAKIKLTFIEPYPERLYSTLKNGDKKRCKVLTKPVQAVSTDQFQQLEKNDVLFIDNSHVSKYGSDVNCLFLKVLPLLKKGVIVHVHDIFYPFEYPIQWVKHENRNWNEAYMLHALLIGSNLFEILFWPSYLKTVDQAKFEKLVPTATGHGGSIWLRRL